MDEKDNMSLEEFHKSMKDEWDRIDNMPWYKLLPIRAWNFIRYRVIGDMSNNLRNIKYFCQEMIWGYSDRDLWNLNAYIIRKMYKPLKAFVKNYEERGMSLPSEFETDPGAWLQVLKKIEFSFDCAWKEENDYDYHPYDGLNREQITALGKRIDEGFELFGKYAMDLWD